MVFIIFRPMTLRLYSVLYTFYWWLTKTTKIQILPYIHSRDVYQYSFRDLENNITQNARRHAIKNFNDTFRKKIVGNSSISPNLIIFVFQMYKLNPINAFFTPFFITLYLYEIYSTLPMLSVIIVLVLWF